jgi:phospholipid/cholesterol/gamma-HCH transport system substrate-binding protein
MTAPANHWKLGLFVIASLLFGTATSIYVGTRSLQRQTVKYTSYFDEAVTGLEQGAPVKFRGVTVGNVASIGVAPDRRHVEVGYDIAVDDLRRLGLAQNHGEQTAIAVPSDLRVQLGQSGVTGVKYVQMDFFDEKDHPRPKLPFPHPERYVPATDSSLKNIERSVVTAVDRMPALTDQMTQTIATANRLLLLIEREQLPQKAAATLTRADAVLTGLNKKIEQVDAKGLSTEAHATLAGLNQALVKVNAVLNRVDGDQGLLASAQQATDSVGAFAANGLGPEWGETLRDLSDAAESLRRVLDQLERDPDMLLKGRAKVER